MVYIAGFELLDCDTCDLVFVALDDLTEALSGKGLEHSSINFQYIVAFIAINPSRWGILAMLPSSKKCPSFCPSVRIAIHMLYMLYSSIVYTSSSSPHPRLEAHSSLFDLGYRFRLLTLLLGSSILHSRCRSSWKDWDHRRSLHNQRRRDRQTTRSSLLHLWHTRRRY